MTTHIALLRAVNLGEHKKVAMADLRELLAELGFEGARSLLQSGNLVFRGGARSAISLEKLLAVETKKKLGVETDFFVRTDKEWKSIVAGNPFVKEAERDPGHLVTMLLRDAPDAKAVSALQKAIVGRETIRAKGRQLYIVYADGIGRSRLTNALIEKKLGTRCTGRNWNTVLKLEALTAE